MKESSNAKVSVTTGIERAGFKGRLFGYFMFFIPLYIGLLIIAALFEEKHRFIPTGVVFIDTSVFLIVLFLFSIYPFYSWEKSIRRFRRAHGLNIYKNVAAEMEQIEFNKMYSKEKDMETRAKEAYSGSGADKSDIGYWFGLLQQGAITQEEYEAKKRELM